MRLVMSLVVSCLDYCNAVFASSPESTVAPLQHVHRRPTHLVSTVDLTSDRHYSDFTHWLPVHIQKNLRDCRFNVLRSTPLLSSVTYWNSSHSATDVTGRRCLNSTTSRSATVHRTQLSICGPTIWNSLPKTLSY